MVGADLYARGEGSGFWRLLGMRVQKLEEGKAELSMTVTNEMKELDGKASPGAIASLIDAAAGVAVTTCLEEALRITTIQLKVSYLLPVEAGRLTVCAEVLYRGKDRGVGAAEVKDDRGRLIAHGSATYLISNPRGTG